MTPKQIEIACKEYNAKYVGLYDLPDREGPFYVFWQEEVPEKFRDDPKYDNYFGLFWRAGWGSDGEWNLYITSAKSIRDGKWPAIKLHNSPRFLVSRYRHDFVSSPSGHAFLDGGLAYTRCNPSHPPTHIMTIVDGDEVYTPIKRLTHGTMADAAVPKAREEIGKGDGKQARRRSPASGPIIDRRIPTGALRGYRCGWSQGARKGSRAVAGLGGGA